MKNKQATLFYGFQIMDVSKKTGLPYGTVFRHANNQREISPKCAVIYHTILGIPLEELLPSIGDTDIINKKSIDSN